MFISPTLVYKTKQNCNEQTLMNSFSLANNPFLCCFCECSK